MSGNLELDALELDAAVALVVAVNTSHSKGAVADRRSGESQALGFMVGQVMKLTRGRYNAAVVQSEIRNRLGSAVDA